MKIGMTACALLLILFASVVDAQERERGQRGRQGMRGFGGQGGVSRTALLRVDAVQKELEMTDDQISKLAELRGTGRGARGEGGERGERGQRGEGGQRGRQGGGAERVNAEIEKLSDVLLEHQMKRLNQIFVQAAGSGVLRDPVVAKKLDISDDQVQQMQEIQREIGSKMRALFEEEGREAAMEKFAEMREASGKEIMGVLTESQKEKLADMKGDAFELPEGAMQRRRRGNRDRGDGDG